MFPADVQPVLARLDKTYPAWQDTVKRVGVEVKKNTPAGNAAATAILTGDGDALVIDLDKQLSDLTDIQIQQAAVSLSDSDAEFNRARTELIVAMVISMLFAWGVAFAISRGIATASEMANGVQQVAANAQRVTEASQQTRQVAEAGVHAVRKTVDGMNDIKAVVQQAAERVEELGKLGEKIGAVVETIDDIAEQTNLLALNAAIEAARAGEHGRGFAAVADEVRKLAERSQRETRAISELIREVQSGTEHAVQAMEAGSQKVVQGALKADEAGTALGQ